jgi:Mg-chelatase subunit ChlD
MSRRSIVFVIDRSGSMVDSFDYLKNAIVDAVSGLRPSQNFHIIMFGGDTPIEMRGKKLVPATAGNMRVAGELLEDTNAQGETDPKPAIKRAFEVLAGPDAKGDKLIVFLTDGDFGGDNEKVLTMIKELNPDREVMISPYLYSEHETKAGKELLEKIAQDNGGKYKFFCTNEAK